MGKGFDVWKLKAAGEGDEHCGNTELMSLPLVSLFPHGHVNSANVEVNFFTFSSTFIAILFPSVEIYDEKNDIYIAVYSNHRRNVRSLLYGFLT